MAEVELGNLAQTQGSDDRIRSYGKKLVEDHAKLKHCFATVRPKVDDVLPSVR